jgi:hypothetical protein
VRNWLKTLLFLSAFSPALFSIAASRFFAHGFCWNETFYAGAGLGGIFIGARIMRFLRTHGEVLTFKAKKIEATDSAMLAVVATYVVPFLGKASDITASGVLGLTALLVAVLWVTSALIPHPALRFLSYRFYKIESENGVVFTVITTRDLLDPKDISKIRQITSTMLVEARDDV